MGAQSYAVGAQPLRSGCAAIAQWMRSNYAVNAQPLRIECAVIAQWVRSITHIDYAVLRSECAAITQRYAVIPLCVMAGFTQITQSLRRRQLADDIPGIYFDIGIYLVYTRDIPGIYQCNKIRYLVVGAAGEDRATFLPCLL